MHPIEDYAKVSAKYHYWKRYRDSGVQKIFGMSLLDFMSLELADAEELLRQASEGMLAENQRASSIESQLEAQLKG